MELQPTLPKGVNKALFTRAIAEYRAALGDANVIVDVDRLAPYTKTMLPEPDSHHQPSGALLVSSVEEVQKVLAICNKYKIPVWPISTGRNFGYGSAAPATAGQLVLDMRQMNKIIEVDPVLSTALVEPGVTYRQLTDYLKANNIPLWPSFPSSGGMASPMGNTLDRGAGYNRHGEHAASFCGMEVVLADGEVLRTGMGGVEGTTAWQAYRWGYGPWVDGLFLQSNLGVVTKIGIWLMKRPPAHQFFVVGYNDLETMAKGVDVMREFRLANVLETGIVGSSLYTLMSLVKRSDIYQGEGSIPEQVIKDYLAKAKQPLYATLSTLYGTPEQLAVNFKLVKEAFEKIGGVVQTGKVLEGNKAVEHWYHNMIGEPSIVEFGNYNFRGGGGSIWFAPVVPAKGEEVIKLHKLIDGIFRKYGFDAASGLLLYGRHADFLVELVFDKTNAEQTKKAYACYDECLKACAKEGYGLYRTNTGFMEKAAETYGPAQRKMNKRLKQALDPNGVIAPGKSGIYV